MRLPFARSITRCAIVVAWCACAFALDPSLDVNQYAHTAWKVRDGFAKGSIQCIAQPPDGYLWLGTEFGLYRFDGVRAVLWQPPGGQQIPGTNITGLLVSRDGTLWIGTSKGLASWKDGKLTTYTELSNQIVFAMTQDRGGTVWVGGISFPSTGKLCAIRSGSLSCSGGDGSLGAGIFDLFEDSRGNLWVGVEGGFWRWKPGRSEFFVAPGESDGIRFGEDGQGLIVGGTAGLKHFKDGHLRPFSLHGVGEPMKVECMLRDRDGALWIGTQDRGLVHLHDGKTDLFSFSDTLTGDRVGHLLEDREGNIWVTTLDGLDRFRGYAISTISVKQGLSGAMPNSIVAEKDGGMWIGTSRGLNEWNRGKISVLDVRIGDQGTDEHPPEFVPTTMFRDGDGRLWISTYEKFGYLQGNRFVPLPEIPSGIVHTIAEAPTGHLWVAHQNAGLFHLFEGKVVQRIPWAGLGHKDYVHVMAADPSGNGLWLGFYQGGMAYFANGGLREEYSAANGFGKSLLNDLRFGPRGALWVATDGGLIRMKDGKVATLTSKNGLPCNLALWTVEDDNHAVWLLMPCGLVRVTKAELDAWATDPNKSVTATLFDSSDGVRSRSYSAGYTPYAAKSFDGKIWFTAWDGVSVVDPHHLPFNNVPPPVHIEQLVADGKIFDASNGLRLPPHVRDLAIDYSALSLVAPEKVHFRFKLEGQDPEWREVVNQRQVQYSNLKPRHYRFRVMACNNSGVWNEAGASLDFSVLPAYYQTIWFRSVCVAAFLFLLWALYEIRVRGLQRKFAMVVDARVNERTRIARELHDTVLQGLHGLLLSFQRVVNLLPENPLEAKQRLQGAIEEATQAITEGRDAVQGLRSPSTFSHDLEFAIKRLGEELAAKHAPQTSPTLEVLVEGIPRGLNATLRGDVFSIAAEALRNAYGHADAHRVEVDIRYGQRVFRLRIRDDGKGMDSVLFAKRGRSGHWGLPGMYERAKLAGGELEIWSKLESGTEIELRIPASIAYNSSAANQS